MRHAMTLPVLVTGFVIAVLTGADVHAQQGGTGGSTPTTGTSSDIKPKPGFGCPPGSTWSQGPGTVCVSTGTPVAPPAPCNAKSAVQWAGTAGSCQGALPIGQHGDNRLLSNVLPDYVGSATYTCNNGAWVLQTATSSCNFAYGVPVVSLTASSTNLQQGDSLTLTWSSTNSAKSAVLSCTGPVAFSQAVPPTGTVTFPQNTPGTGTCTVQATNIVGPSTSTPVSITVATPPPSTLAVAVQGPTGPQVTDLTVTVGDTYTLIWSSSKLSSLSLSCTGPGAVNGTLPANGSSIGTATAAMMGRTDCLVTGTGNTTVTQRYSVTVAPPAASVWALVDDGGAPVVDLVTSMGKSLRLNWGSSFVSNINVVCNGAKASVFGLATSGTSTTPLDASYVGKTDCLMTGTSLSGNVTQRYSFDVAPVSCPPGWEWDAISLKCKQKGSPPVTRSIPLDLLNETMQRLKNPAYKPTKPGSPPYFYSVITKGTIVGSSGVGPKQEAGAYLDDKLASFWRTEWFDLACVVSSAMPDCVGFTFWDTGGRGSVMSKVVGNQRIDVLKCYAGGFGDNLDRVTRIFAINITVIDDGRNPLQVFMDNPPDSSFQACEFVADPLHVYAL